MFERARGQSIPSSCSGVSHHAVAFLGRGIHVDDDQEEPVAVILDAIFIVFRTNLTGWMQEVELAADRRPARRRRAGEELWEREHVEAEE
jgi:hypothetical protein